MLLRFDRGEPWTSQADPDCDQLTRLVNYLVGEVPPTPPRGRHPYPLAIRSSPSPGDRPCSSPWIHGSPRHAFWAYCGLGRILRLAKVDKKQEPLVWVPAVFDWHEWNRIADPYRVKAVRTDAAARAGPWWNPVWPVPPGRRNAGRGWSQRPIPQRETMQRVRS